MSQGPRAQACTGAVRVGTNQGLAAIVLEAALGCW
jgi:hypothetical protein